MTTRRIVDVTLTDTTGMKRLLSATNYVKNPRAGVNAAGYSGSGGTGGLVALSAQAAGGPADAPSFLRMTVTTAPTGGTLSVTLGATAGYTDIDPADIGSEFRFAFYARASKTVTIAAPGGHPVIGWYDGAGAFIAGSSLHGAATLMPAGVWVRHTAVVSVAPANSARASLQLQMPVAGITGGVAVGDTFDVTGLSLYKTNPAYDGTYFDGSTPGASWAGAAHASRSSKFVGIG